MTESMNTQDWLDFEEKVDGLLSTKTIVVSTTASVPTKSSDRSDGIDVGTLIVDTQAKAFHIVTAVAADGTLTKTAIGSWGT